MYVSHLALDIILTGCSYNHLKAFNTGGFIEGANLKTFTISDCVNMVNITAVNKGSFIQSASTALNTFSMTGCSFDCLSGVVVPT
jgi:hypothetical protein